MQYHVHFDKKFYLDEKTGYWISTTGPKIKAHIWVSEKSVVTPSEHYLLHETCERKENARNHMNAIRPLTKAWHSSEQGRSWHKDHGKNLWVNRKSIEGLCTYCSEKFITKTYHQKFCSNNCKSAYRRAHKIDEISRSCNVCGHEFKCNKYSKRKFCSRRCYHEIT